MEINRRCVRTEKKGVLKWDVLVTCCGLYLEDF